MNLNKIILSGNCYWCVEAMFQKVHGCVSIIPGHFHFSNSSFLGKVEAVEILFNPIEISFENILNVFFISHNPTLVNWTVEDCIFPLNRSSIIYNNDIQKSISYLILEQIQKEFDTQVHTKIINNNEGLFIPVKENEQNYYINNPEESYCLSIISPKIDKLKLSLNHLLK